MLRQTIFRVKKITLGEIHHNSGDTYARDIKIHSEDGDLNITMFGTEQELKLTVQEEKQI